MGIAPSVSSGVQTSVSPVLGLLALSRIFGQEFASLPSKYELMFILNPSASLDFQASSKFIDYLSSSIKNRIQLVICLDTLVSLGKLYVYDSLKSSKSQLRDYFVNKLGAQEKGI